MCEECVRNHLRNCLRVVRNFGEMHAELSQTLRDCEDILVCGIVRNFERMHVGLCGKLCRICVRNCLGRSVNGPEMKTV